MCFLGLSESFETAERQWLYNAKNLLNATESCVKWFIVRYAKFSSVFYMFAGVGGGEEQGFQIRCGLILNLISASFNVCNFGQVSQALWVSAVLSLRRQEEGCSGPGRNSVRP